MWHFLQCNFSQFTRIMFVYTSLLRVFLPVLSTRSIKFAFPVFQPHETHHFITLGDVHHNPDHRSFLLNAQTGDGAKLLYTDTVRMKSKQSGAVASFHTCFSFVISQSQASLLNNVGWRPNTSGFVFSFTSDLQQTLMFLGPHSHLFAIEVDTYDNHLHEDPSNNHIGVDINSLKSAYSYNLCGDNSKYCFFPWTGQTYTLWVDYDGLAQSLEVSLANGSMADGVSKPVDASLIKVEKIELNHVFTTDMYVGFSGGAGHYKESHEIVSWSFESSLTEDKLQPTTLFTTNVYSISVSFGFIAILLGGFFLTYWERELPDQASDHLARPRKFAFKELKKATKNFNDGDLLGKGGSGSVYRGTIMGIVVAVKRLKHESEFVEREFLAELSSVSQIRHRNLVQLIGWCHERDQFLLVFDYMGNGALDEWLHPTRRRNPHDPKYKKFPSLPWALRFSILSGVAAALEYLQEDWVQCVLHRDIKSSNVMLDEDFHPHLGDFGLARLVDHDKMEKTTMMAGTMGYMAPEIAYTGKASKESDVYSFGVLMLEILCGRRPINLQVEDPKEDFSLVQSVWKAHEAGEILSAVDHSLLQTNHQKTQTTAASHQISLLVNPVGVLEPELPPKTLGQDLPLHLVESRLKKLLNLGLQCCSADSEARPSIRVVKHVITQLQDGSVEDPALTVPNLMPTLPPTMPSYGEPQSKSPTMLAPSDVAPDGSNSTTLRHRYLSSCL